MSGRDVLVIGAGKSGRAVIDRARRSGRPVMLLDEGHGPEELDDLMAMGVAVYTALGDLDLDDTLERCELVVPSPGVPFSHPVLVAAGARGVPVRSEIDLAIEVATAPIVAVTGTNGKTTVTSLLDEIFRADGRTSVAVGNIGAPMLDVVDDDVNVIVVETSSFQLQFTHDPGFRVAVWLNIADDHYDWHTDFAHYAAAKARITDGQTETDLFVFNADDPEVAARAEQAPGRRVGFSVAGRSGCYRLHGEDLVTPDGRPILARREMPAAAPHDVANALASIAAAHDLGVSDSVIADVLRRTTKLPHRVEWICEAGGVDFVDDSKATNPHATLAAIAGYDRVVLIAGGRNKGLDLGVLEAAAPRLREVVAIGDAANEVVSVFGDLVPTVVADSMGDAVRKAAGAAVPGDTVLLSPACASFDWYGGYAERGDEFAAEARAYALEQLA